MEQTTVNIGQSRLNMQAVPLASSILEILPARGTRPNEKNKCRPILEKSDSKECNALFTPI